MKKLQSSICKKCKQPTMTLQEVWVCPHCGTTNVSYVHIMNDIASGLGSLAKKFKK